jgi:hypothetical protein
MPLRWYLLLTLTSAPLLMATVNESPVEVEVWCPQSPGTSTVQPDWCVEWAHVACVPRMQLGLVFFCSLLAVPRPTIPPVWKRTK